ncbi:MAG: superoxide dismutase, Ni [Halioglobus sp.]|nr:superoxide dismutase, Ni [Halioglobus sp.]
MKTWLNVPIAHAHCDIPCGIYDPMSAQLAALSVARFLDQIAETATGGLADAAAQVRLARLTAEKEAHAAQVKSEIVVIWGDYFKPEHFEQHPMIHDLTHRTLRQASACKQELSPDNGRKLVELVNAFAEIFWQTKDIETQRVTVPYEPKLDIVQPILSSAS